MTGLFFTAEVRTGSDPDTYIAAPSGTEVGTHRSFAGARAAITEYFDHYGHTVTGIDRTDHASLCTVTGYSPGYGYAHARITCTDRAGRPQHV